VPSLTLTLNVSGFWDRSATYHLKLCHGVPGLPEHGPLELPLHGGEGILLRGHTVTPDSEVLHGPHQLSPLPSGVIVIKLFTDVFCIFS
jgi:hypothetical protein